MARLITRLPNLLFLIFVLVSSTLSASVPPTNSDYLHQYLENVEICAATGIGLFAELGKKKIRLSNFSNNTVSMKISRWEDYSGSFYNYNCKFQVSAPKGQGVMAVIQSLHMRTKEGPKNTTICKDYIKFEDHSNKKSPSICGEIEKKDPNPRPAKLIGPRYFYDSTGEMDVIFSTQDLGPKDEKRVDLHIVFTAYSDCSGNELEDMKVKACSRKRDKSCVPSGLFCDNVINCGFDEDDFGDDEMCSNEARSAGELESSFSHFTLIFVVTLIATLVSFVLVIAFVCCCCRRVASKRRTVASSQTQNNPESLEFNLDISGPPSAPPRTLERSSPSGKIEDLPPAYDALFPFKDQQDSKCFKK